MKYTKGPWKLRHWTSKVYDKTKGEKVFFRHYDFFDVTSCEGVVVEQISNVGNATLIAAAPTMHLLLETLVDRLLVDDMSNYGKDQAEALYAAASFLKTLKGDK